MTRCWTASQAADNKWHLLLVEDQDELRHVIRDIMARYGYQKLVARDADEALL